MKTRSMIWREFMAGKISRQEYDRLVDECFWAVMYQNLDVFKRLALK